MVDDNRTPNSQRWLQLNTTDESVPAHLENKQVEDLYADTTTVLTSNISEIFDDSFTSCGEDQEKNYAQSTAGNESPILESSDYTVSQLHSKIKRQKKYIDNYVRKIKTLQNKNRRYQLKIKNIEELLGPILQKISALKDVNLQAQTLIQRQLKNKSSGEGPR